MIALNAPADPRVSEPAPARPQRSRALDNLWVAASSSQFTIALAVLLAFTFVIAAMLPQLPPGSDSLTADRWLSTTAARYGRFGPFLSSSGLFSVLAGPWIITLLALTAFHMALRVMNQARHLVTRTEQIPAAPQRLPFELVHLPVEIEAVHARVNAFASARTPKAVVLIDPAGQRPRVDAYVESRHWAAAGPFLTYLGPLLVVLGLLWNTVGGWRVTDVTLLPGRIVQPSQAAGLALSLVDAGDVEGRRPGLLSLARGNQTRNAWLGYARPANWGSVWVAQRTSGPALAVRAFAGNSPLPVQALEDEGAVADSLHLRFGENESEQAFTIPGRNLAFRVVNYESLVERGIDRPVFLVEGYEGTDPTPGLNELVEDSRTIEWQGAVLALQREAYMVVDLAAIPGLPMLLLGALVLLAGVVVTAWGGLIRIWVNAAADRDGTLLAVRAATPALGQAQVAGVAAKLAAPESDASAPVRDSTLPKYAAWTLAASLAITGMVGVALGRVDAPAPSGQTWILILHAGLAILGIGALLVGAAQSLSFALRGNRLTDVTDPALRGPIQGLRARPGDPGRGVALAAFPLLSGAVVLGSVWAILVSAAPVTTLAAQAWLLAAWFFASAYFHATSGWRPLRTPGWLAPVLVLVALAAGVAACLAAPSLLTR